MIKTNRHWKLKKTPSITVMTPVYNRRSTLGRTIDSVEKQSFRNIEYIIIDDGSTESIDDIVSVFMKSTDLPVMYIKKKNGGVHTARNEGYRHGRGELVICIDSDDELLPEACEGFYNAWMSIPEEERSEYWQMKALLVSGDGQRISPIFPNNVNSLPKEKARKCFSLAKGDQIGCRSLNIMKENLFPEPDGVTFVTENTRWVPLEYKYRSWGINKAMGIVHREKGDGLNHLSYRSKKKTKQDLRNSLWNTMYQLNNAKIFDLRGSRRIKTIFKYCILRCLLIRTKDREFVNNNSLKGVYNEFWVRLLWCPSIIIARIYSVKMKT